MGASSTLETLEYVEDTYIVTHRGDELGMHAVKLIFGDGKTP
jgi:hypothetical protein